jgi:aryl-alcohol dehydrogenase-like predicted oxidoreductase
MPVTRLSLGTAQLGMVYGIAGPGTSPTERHATSMLHAAYDLGIASIDTAPDYGLAEQRVGAFLRDQNLHEAMAICTKLPSLAKIETARVEQQVEDGLTASLRRLRADVVDTYLIHDSADLTRHGRALIDALCHQRDKGRTLSIGVSVYGPDELALLDEYVELGVAQHPFNLLDRRLVAAGWPERLAASGTRLHVRSALLQGLLAMSPEAVPVGLTAARPLLVTLGAMLGRFGLTPATAALPYAFSIDPDCIVVGADTIEHLEGLVASASTVLPEELFVALDRELGAVSDAIVDPRTWPSA